MTFMQLGIFTTIFTFVLLLFPYRRIDKRLEPSVEWVMNIVNEECPKKNYFWPPKIIIKIAEEPSYSYVGICRTNPVMFVIEVQEYFYNLQNHEFMNQLLAHELIHCLFMQGHIKQRGNLMNPEFQPLEDDYTEEQLREFAKKSCQKKSE